MINIYRHNCNDKEPACNDNELSCIYKQHPIPGSAILKTGSGSLGLRTLDFTNISTLILNQRIASATIDTAKMRNPKLLIDFNGILNITADIPYAITFNFALTRTCKNNKATQTLTTFTFNALNGFTFGIASRVLKFEYSPDDDLCEDCCSYNLQLTSIQTDQSFIFNFDISSGVISILAVDSKKGSCFSDESNKGSGNTLLSINSNIFYTRSINFTSPNFLATLNQPIARIHMDTTFMKKPKLLLDFTGILEIASPDTIVETTLNFTLFKLPKSGKVRTPLTSFAFSYSNLFALPHSETLKFEYSPCEESCDECCIYILELTSVHSMEGTIDLSLNNVTFFGLVFDSCLNKYNKLSGNSIFSSNNSSLSAGFIRLDAGQLTRILNLPIVSTTIDTSYLNTPKLLIDFTGIITSLPILITETFNFTLYRIYINSNVLEPLTTFVYNLKTLLAVNEGNTLKFEYSPCDDICGACFTYILELTSITASEPISFASSSISNVVLSIIAVESCD